MTSLRGDQNHMSAEQQSLASRLVPRDLQDDTGWYRDLVAHSGDLLCVHDLQGRLLSVNPAPARLLGYTVEELLSIPLREFIPPEFRPQFDEYLKKITGEGEAHGLLALMTRSGERCIWEYHNTLRTEGVAEPVVRGIAHDVTERVRAEKALRQTNERLLQNAREQEAMLGELKLFRTLLDRTSDAIEVIEPGTMRLLDINEKACKELGYTREELLTMTVYDINPSITPEATERMRAEMHEAGYAILDCVHRRKDGTTFPVEVNVRCVRMDRQYMVAVSRDVTERKRAEEELRQSEERYRSVITAMAEGVVLMDADRRLLASNPSAEKIIGIKPEELSGPTTNAKDWEPYTTHEDGSPFLSEDYPASVTLRTGEPQTNVCMGLRLPGRELRWLLLNSQPLCRPGQSKPYATVVSFTDITERKRDEAALRESEARLRLAQEAAKIGSFERNMQTGEGRWTPETEAMFGLEPGTGPPSLEAFVQLAHPEDRQYVEHLLAESVATGVTEGEWRVVWPDGSVHWILGRWRVFKDEHGRPLRAIGMDLDITDRKRAEAALRETERNLRTLVDNDPDCIVRFDSDGRILFLNPAAETVFGLRAENVVGKTLPAVALPEHRAQNELAESMIKRAFQEGVANKLEARWKVSEGARAFDVVHIPEKDESGKVVSVLGIARDITERKQAEDELRRSAERYRSLVEATAQVVWTMDAGEAVDLPIWCEFTGQSPEQARGDGWLESVHPDDREGTKAAWSEAVKNRTVYEREHRVRRRDGEYFFLSVRGVPIRDKDGRIREWIGTCTDITEPKRIAEELHAGQEMIAQAQDAAHLGCFNWDIKNNRIVWSQEQENIYGLAPGTFGGRYEDWRAMVLPEDREKAEVRLDDLMGGGEAAAEFRILHQTTGQTRWVGAKGRVFTDSDGNPSRMIGINMDITERKRVEEALREAKECLTEEKLYLEHAIDSEMGFEEIIGKSAGLRAVMEQVAKVAACDATVLLLGETGVGKELVARAIHRLSLRHGASFIKMNCAAIPTGLLESELFGAEKGAFTGSVSKKLGRLELADKGTIFLDEIGEISLALQPKLLRVLQDHQFERLGGTRTLKVDFRLIAATNRDLAECVQNNEFRRDLYYRLNVFPIRVPALRERRDDIPLLVEHFVHKCARRLNKTITSVPQKTMDVLVAWNWPGNIRELENFIERSVILTYGSVLAAPLAELQEVAGESASDETLAGAERQLILRALRESHGKISGEKGAAARLGLKRTTLQSKLKQMKIDPRRPQA